MKQLMPIRSYKFDLVSLPQLTLSLIYSISYPQSKHGARSCISQVHSGCRVCSSHIYPLCSCAFSYLQLPVEQPLNSFLMSQSSFFQVAWTHHEWAGEVRCKKTLHIVSSMIRCRLSDVLPHLLYFPDLPGHSLTFVENNLKNITHIENTICKNPATEHYPGFLRPIPTFLSGNEVVHVWHGEPCEVAKNSGCLRS